MSNRSSAYRDNRWQKKRLKILERDKWTCRSCGCGKDGDMLSVHHIYYLRGKKPWEYPDDLLVTWCQNCHDKRHEIQNTLLVAMADLSLERMDIFVELITTGPEDKRELPLTFYLTEMALDINTATVQKIISALGVFSNATYNCGYSSGAGSAEVAGE